MRLWQPVGLRLIDTIRANWLSDASFPSKHVRQNALSGSYVFPNSYNGAWIVKDPEIDKTTDPDLLDTIYRSRMMGLFGFGTLTGKLPEMVSLYSKPVLDAAKRNIPVYKKYRHLLQRMLIISFRQRDRRKDGKLFSSPAAILGVRASLFPQR